MKSIEILALGIRLVGVYFVVQVLQFFAFAYNAIMQWNYSGFFENILLLYGIYTIAGLVFLLTCFFLIRFPVTVAGWLLPKSTSDEPVFNGSVDDLSIAPFTILGVYILSWAIPDFFYNGSMIFYLNYTGVEHLYNNDSLNTHIINQVITVLEISIGLYLCLKAKGLYALIMKLRGAGHSKIR